MYNPMLSLCALGILGLCFSGIFIVLFDSLFKVDRW